MMKVRSIAAFVLLGTVAGMSVTALPAQASTFVDVPSSHWAYEVIDTMSEENIMVGRENGLFAPEATLSRAEFASVLYHLRFPKESTTSGYEAPEPAFVDVHEDDWFFLPMSWAVDRGFLSEDQGVVRPNAPITREEMGSAMFEFLRTYCSDKLVYGDDGIDFLDADLFCSAADRQKIAILNNNGLIAGKDENHFDPQGFLTRAEAAAVASRIQDVIELPDKESPFKEQALEALTRGTLSVNRNEQQFIDLLNSNRKEKGVQELEPSPMLMEAAKQRAKEVCEKSRDLTREEFLNYEAEYFHTRPDGSHSKTVLDPFLNTETVVVSSHIYYGENLARSWGGLDMTPKEAYDCLLTSPGHVANMMHKNYDYIGVGFFNDGKSSVWVQLFGSAR